MNTIHDEQVRRYTAQSPVAKQMLAALEGFEAWWNGAFVRSLMEAGFTGTQCGPATKAMLNEVSAAIAAAKAAGIEADEQ